jgi:hypothetical protein
MEIAHDNTHFGSVKLLGENFQQLSPEKLPKKGSLFPACE